MNVRHHFLVVVRKGRIPFFTMFWMILLSIFIGVSALGVESVSGQPVILLEFTSSGCGACQQIKPLLDEMKSKGYPIRTVSLDHSDSRELFRRYKIGSMPSFVMLLNGEETGRFVSQGEPISEVQQRLLQLFTAVTARQALLSQETKSVPEPSREHVPAQDTSVISPVSAMLTVPNETPGGSTSSLSGTHAAPQVTPPLHDIGAGPAMTQSAVQIRVYHANEVDRGTGTIIHVNRGQQQLEALVLTCGHIFRSSKGEGRIEVDVFHPETGKQVTVGGECIQYDAETDVAFIGMPLPFPIKPVTVVPPEYRTRPGDRVVSIGCSNGDLPTLLEHQVLTTDKKYFKPTSQNSTKKPFYYIQVSTAPTGGRSGGGLFVRDDEGLHLLGVCNAGDAETNEGYFVPAAVVYEEMLACSSLSFVYNDLVRQNRELPGTAAPAMATVPIQDAVLRDSGKLEPVSAVNAPAVPLPVSNSSKSPENIPGRNAAASGAIPVDSSTLLNAGLEEIKKRQQEGAEIICIVKWPETGSNMNASREMEVIRLPRK